jgi:hypothetical protein
MSAKTNLRLQATYKSFRVNTGYCINRGTGGSLCGESTKSSPLGYGSAGIQTITCRKCISKWNKMPYDGRLKRIYFLEDNGFPEDPHLSSCDS